LAQALDDRGYQIDTWTPGETAPSLEATSVSEQTSDQSMPDRNDREHRETSDWREGEQKRKGSERWQVALEEFLRSNG
jgi:hypothetical protein